jgi:hypothetical protein
VVPQAGLALPNALNAVIAFCVTLLSFLAVAERRESCLYISAALVAIAVNMKIDAILLGGVLGLAILLSGWRAGLAGLGRQALISGGIFALVHAVTNPQVLIDSGFVLSRLKPLVGDVPLGLAATVRQNLGVLRLFLENNLVPQKISDTPIEMISIGLVALAVAILAVVHRQRGADLPALAIPAAALLLLWLYPMLTITIFYGRYYLNGLGALYALIGAALVTAWRLRTPPGRACVLAILALLLVQYGALMSANRAAAAQSRGRNVLCRRRRSARRLCEWLHPQRDRAPCHRRMAQRRIRPNYPGRSARLLRSADAAVGGHEAGLCQPVQRRGGAAGARSIGRSLAAALAGELCDGSELVAPVGDLMDA